MNTQGATEPEIEAALGAPSAPPVPRRRQALNALNRAITATPGTSRSTRTSPTSATTPPKVTAPEWAGANNYLVLSSIKPAAG